jgi:NTE family protein
MQDRITRSRMAGDPPDLLLAPSLEHLGLLEFYRAGEAIEEGRNCVDQAGKAIDDLFLNNG